MNMQADSIPNLKVTIVDIGDSYLKTQNPNQGHDILALEITGSGNDEDKPVFFAMAGIHPREYTPPVLLAHWAQELIDGYGDDVEITHLLDRTKISLVLQSNPDGRELAETSEIWRRKNLNTEDGFCGSSGGVDLNRNLTKAAGFGWSSRRQRQPRKCRSVLGVKYECRLLIRSPHRRVDRDVASRKASWCGGFSPFHQSVSGAIESPLKASNGK